MTKIEIPSNFDIDLDDFIHKTDICESMFLKQEFSSPALNPTPYDDATKSIKEVIPIELSHYLSNINFKDETLKLGEVVSDICGVLENIYHKDIYLNISNPDYIVYIGLGDTVLFKLTSLIHIINKIRVFYSDNITFIH